MERYEERARREWRDWQRSLHRKSGPLQRLSKKMQTKVNDWIPDKANRLLTESVKKMVQAALVGSEYTTRRPIRKEVSLEKIEDEVWQTLDRYKKIAAAEGAGTGAGGILLGLADFPMLLAIKMKFLFETAALYGWDVSLYEERLYILHIFQLAFSSDGHRLKTWRTIANWEQEKRLLREVDWRLFQQEYRDYIDFVKMLQLLPGIGAVVGAYANYNLLDHLGKTAMNCYRTRYFALADAE